MVQRFPGVDVEVFEAVVEFAAKILGARAYGLLDRDCRLPVKVAGDASGAFGAVASAAVTGSVECEFRDVVSEMGGRFVDVMKLNVEGGEYDILDRMLATGVMRQVGSLLVQFHGFVPGAERRRQGIIEGLAGTHVRRWCEPWVWERWDLCRCGA
jgi:hypothetical protein